MLAQSNCFPSSLVHVENALYISSSVSSVLSQRPTRGDKTIIMTHDWPISCVLLNDWVIFVYLSMAIGRNLSFIL